MKNLLACALLACLCLMATPVFSLNPSNGDPKAPAGTINIQIIADPPLCDDNNGGAIHCFVTGTKPPFTYIWSTGANTSSVFGLYPGYYVVTVTDAEGATATAEAIVPEANNPIVIDYTTTDVSHYGENNGAISLTVCGGTPNYFYTWSNGNTTKNLNNLTAGTYSVTVYDSQNCWTAIPITVSQPGPSGMKVNVKSVKNIPCSGGCGGVALENLPNVTYSWVGPNGFTTNTSNPVICNPGTYTVIATDVLTGATATKSFNIRHKSFNTPAGLYPQIQSSNPAFCNSNAPGECEQICPNTTVTYTAGPINLSCGPVEYTWTVTGAKSYSVSASGDAVTVLWGEPGSGRVRLLATSNILCENSTERCITIQEIPEAKFASSPAPATAGGNLVVCKDQPVWFHNQSAGAMRYEWFFGDDQSNTTEENPKHEFRTPGIFPITLIARSQCFCADTATLMVEVLDTETPLVECVSTLCPGEAVTYSTPANCPDYQWTVSPNGQVLAGGGPSDNSITVQWLSGPDGTLTLSTGNCGSAACPEPAVLRVPVLSDLAQIEGPERVCPGTEAAYSIEPYDGTYYAWKLPTGGTILEGQGTPKIVVEWGTNIYSANFPLIVEYENCYLDCSGRDTIWVNVRPTFGLTGPLELCANAKGTMNAKLANNLNLNCQWTLYAPDGNPVWTSPAAAVSVNPEFNFGAGTYRMLAVPSAADWSKTCSDSADWNVLVRANPSKPDGIDGSPVFCPGQPVTLKATGVTTQSKIRWMVKSSTAPASVKEGNPIVVEFTAGSPRWVSAQQVSANSLGCASDTVWYEIKELTAPAISGSTQLCAGDLQKFSAPDYPNLKYEWSLFPADAGAIKTGQGTHEVEVFWPHAGVFELRLSVCGKQSTQLIIVNAPPEPQPVFPAGVCAGEKAQATASNGQLYQAYLWKDEKGGAVGTGFEAQLGPGKYALVVTNDKGCRGTAEMTIDEYPLPNLTISTVDPTGFCANSRTVTMSALTTKDGDFQYEWYRDNVPLGINAPVYTTNQYGYYKASVTNQYGCKATDGPIHVFEYCQGVCHNPNHGPVCAPGSVDFVAVPTPECDRFQFKLIAGADYQPGSATWRFGESGSSYLGSATSDNPEFTFPNASQYIVVLYAYLQNGARCVVIDSVKVEAAAQFGQVPGCPGDSTFLKDVSTFLPQSQITQWVWNFDEPSSGAANTSNLRDVKHSYAAAGIYDVTLTVTAASGCTSSYTRPVNVPALPDLIPIPQNALCAGNGVPMVLLETPDLTRIHWDFGDPASGMLNSAQGDSVVHKYETPGSYTATVTVNNVAGCQNTITQNVDITPNTLAGAISPGGKSTICAGASLGLNVPAVGTNYQWSNGASGPAIQVSEAGVYSVTISDAMGCTFTPPAKTVEVNPAPGGEVKAILTDENGQVAGIAQGSLTTCQGENVLLFADADGVYTYKWTGNSLGSTLYFTEDRNNLLPVGLYNYVVTLTNTTTGCTATTAPFAVSVNPVPGNVSAATDQECAGTPATVAYTGLQQPGYQYFWNNGEVGPSFVTKEAGHYFVRVVNQFGCAASSEKVTIRPGPNIGAVPSGCHRRCAPDSLCLPPMPDIVSWQWYFNGTPIPGATGPTIVADASGVYWAHLVDGSGCNAQSVPLTLELYTGTGNVTGQVWSDVNNNGAIDAADTLLSGIPVRLWQNGALGASLQSGAGGSFIFSNVPSVNGFVAVDSTAMPSNWKIVIGQSNADLVGCKATALTGLLLRACIGSSAVMNVSACAGTFYEYNGTSIAAGGSQQFFLQNAAGCDSVLTVNVATLPVSSGELNVSACAGAFYDYNGTSIAAGSTQQFLLQNAAGCDSVLTVNVTTLPVSSGELNVSACADAFYDYNGTSIAAGQSQQFLLQNAAGCDSVLTVNVATLPVSSGELNVSACAGAFYDYDGTSIAAGSSQQFLLQNAAGCDSVLTVNVATLPVSSGELNVSACAGSFYDYNGTSIAAGQSQQFLLQNAAGCDSVLTVNVTTLPVSSGELNVSACAGSFYDYDGTPIAAGQSQQFLLQNAAGCDSVLTVNVAALPVSSGELNVSACAGSFYDYNGAQIAAGSSQQFLLQNAAGCDSVLTVNVAVLPVSSGELNVSACAGSFYDYNGAQIAAGSTQQFLLQNAAGCDSVLTVNVAVLPVSSGELNVSACAGAFYDYNGTSIAAGSSQQFLLQNAAGCDSVLTVHVAALPVSSGELNVSACAGSFYDYNGTQIVAGQSRQFLLQNAAGCDSILTVKVTAASATTGSYTARVCPGQTYSFQGVELQIGESLEFVLQNAAGCDSMLTLTVAALNSSSETLAVRVCPGETYTYQGEDLLPGETRVFHFSNSEGCDSTVTIVVSAFPEAGFDLLSTPSCPDAANGRISVSNTAGGLPPYRYSLDGVSFQDDPRFEGLGAGTYAVWLKDGNGCLFRQDAEVPARAPLTLQMDDAALPCDGKGLTLTPVVSGDPEALRYWWSTGAETPAITVQAPGQLWLEVRNVCDTLRREIAVQWEGQDKDFSYVYMPNAFAPASADPANAEFRPAFFSGLEILEYRMEVYDRWGSLIFRSMNPAEAWPGLERDKQAAPGVFVWMLHARVLYCGQEVELDQTGSVTLVR